MYQIINVEFVSKNNNWEPPIASINNVLKMIIAIIDSLLLYLLARSEIYNE